MLLKILVILIGLLLFYRIWAKIQHISFIKARVIYTLTEGMKMALSEYVDNAKIKIVPIWTDNNFLKPIPKENNFFIKENSLENFFLVMYSGNLGIANDLKMVIDAISKLNNPNICLVVIGRGNSREKLITYCQSKGSLVFKFLDWQTPEMMKYSFASADLAIVNLGNIASKIGIPSKLFNFLSVGTPILSITEKGNDLANLIEKYNIGKAFSIDEGFEIVYFIDSLFNNKTLQNTYSNNSLKASLDFTKSNLNKIII